MSAFWNNVKFPFFDMQSLNLDWILTEVKRIAGFMPQDGNSGDFLVRTADGAAWEPLEAIEVDIKNLPEDTEIGDNDQLIFYDISAQANRKIKPPNLLNSMMSDGTPLMDGTAAPGTSKKPARYDHRHPTDTSRQAALSGAQMAAVNSGAAANSFPNGVLDAAHGGSGAADAFVNGILSVAHGGTGAANLNSIFHRLGSYQSGFDPDSVTVSGFQHVSIAADHSPTGSGFACMLLTFTGDGQYAVQIAAQASSMYLRQRNVTTGVWSTWHPVTVT